MGSELLTSERVADGECTVIPYTISWQSRLFGIQRRRWKYWKLSQEWVIIAAWVQAGPQSQNNSVGWNVLWKQTWTLSGTGHLFIPRIQALLLQAAWHSHAPYFIYSLWINNTDSDKSYSYWSMSGCVCVCMYCMCVINVKSVTEQLCLEQTLRSCYFVQWLNCLFSISPPLPHPVCIYLSQSHPLTHTYPLQWLSSVVALPLLCLRPGETLR